MDFLFAFLTVVFVALMLAFAFTLGLTLFGIIVLTAVVAAVLTLANDAWRRWRFTRFSDRVERPPSVIDAEYRDITQDKEK